MHITHAPSRSDIDRDIVSIALSYFDRYLSCHASIPETLFQLVAMTSLYLAVKLHSTRKISAISMVRDGASSMHCTYVMSNSCAQSINTSVFAQQGAFSP